MADDQITVTGKAQRRAWNEHVLPPVERVRPGLWSVPTPFPNSPLRYVLAYLLETARGPVLVDTGWPSADAWDGLVAGVAATDGCTTFEVAERLAWSRPWDQSRGLVRRSAIGETYAHLFHLEQRGRLANAQNPADHWRVVRPTARTS